MKLFSGILGGKTIAAFDKFLLECNVPFAISRMEDGLFVAANDRFLETFNIKRDHLKRYNSRSIALWQSTYERNQFIDEIKQQNTSIKTTEIQPQNANDPVRYIEMCSHIPSFDSGKYIITCILDNTEKHRLTQELEYTKNRLASLIAAMKDGFIVLDKQFRIKDVNQRFCEMLGYSKDKLELMHLKDIVPETRYERTMPHIMKQIETDGCTDVHESEMYRHNKTIKPVRIRAYTHESTEPSKSGYWLIAQDIEQSVEMSSEHSDFYCDSATQLPNKLWFLDRIARMIARAKLTDDQMALLYIDIDHFSLFNDIYGHEFGDKVLRALASRIERILRANDIFARMDNDEFALLICSKNIKNNIFDIVRRIQGILSELIEIDYRNINATTCIGISLFPQDSLSDHELIDNAIAATLRAKDYGCNKFEFCSKEQNIEVREQLALENALNDAMLMQDIAIEFQPQINLDDNRVLGFEALIRWKNPTYNTINADRFIALAVKMGLITDIDRLVITAVCTAISHWKERQFTPKIAINISQKTLESAGFIHWTIDELKKHGVESTQIAFEVSEAALLANTNALQTLGNYGIELIVDRFSGNVAALSELKKVGVKKLKYYSNIIDVLDKNLLKNIYSINRTLGFETVIVGVGTEEHASMLQGVQGAVAQGFYYAASMNEESTMKFALETPNL
ncbi:hypothetical protein AGMMS50229_16740 [Campylobacterota bacterium]|nr:hypothetical protein AGMMS50229_16740 [Campylobacterota bacterium]